MKLRPYQEKAVESIFENWKSSTSTLCVMPTGCGKTQVFCEVLRRSQSKRAMILVHREELCIQAVNRLKNFGINAEIEMGNQMVAHGMFNDSNVIVSSFQTQMSGAEDSKRMLKFKPNDFGVLIADECHHLCAPSWKKVLDYYKLNPDLKILGVTATPDRADERALGQIFENVSYDYEIIDAIDDGWLVPIHQMMVEIQGLDFSQMRTTAGDLNGAELSEVMESEKNLHEVVSTSLEIIKEKRSLVFAVSVKQAERLADIFNRHKPGMADWLCGKTPKEERREKLKKFDEGKIQVMVNVGVLTEGYDSPGIEVIIQARPTKSRSLYSQMIGRSTRPLPGLVDQFDNEDDRKKAIAESSKKNCLVIDFVGNSGKHKLITTADLLGGNFDDKEIALAEQNAREKNYEVDMQEELLNARKEIEEKRKLEAARRAKLVARVRYSTIEISPFDIFGFKPQRERLWDEGKKLSEKQKTLLMSQGINPDTMNYSESKQLIDHLFHRWKHKLCTLKQAKLLKRHGYEINDLSMKAASDLIDALAKNNWRRPHELVSS